jgi:hypothetical protein
MGGYLVTSRGGGDPSSATGGTQYYCDTHHTRSTLALFRGMIGPTKLFSHQLSWVLSISPLQFKRHSHYSTHCRLTNSKLQTLISQGSLFHQHAVLSIGLIVALIPQESPTEKFQKIYITLHADSEVVTIMIGMECPAGGTEITRIQVLPNQG